jgi:hypothetical protein
VPERRLLLDVDADDACDRPNCVGVANPNRMTATATASATL